MTERRLSLVQLLGFMVLALVVGFAAGSYRAGASIHTGRADVDAGGDGSISTEDWTYSYGSGVFWIDQNDTWHEGGVPDCLPALSSTEGVRFAAVDVSVEGATWRPVVWIDCQSVPPR